ncbi:MAG: NfeD family protein, partial [Anaerolineae bacterium]
TIVSILLVIGVQAILIELGSPGGWVAGFIGVLALGLAFYGLGQLPANWFGLGLVAVAFVLFALEVKTPTVGGLATAGTLTLLSGLLIMFNSPGSPEFARISIPSALTISLGTAVFFVFAVTKALRAQQMQPVTGLEGLLGKTGPARHDFTSDNNQPPYKGTVLVNGEIWQAQADEQLQKDDEVEVTAIKGFTLTVHKTGKEKSVTSQ